MRKSAKNSRRIDDGVVCKVVYASSDDTYDNHQGIGGGHGGEVQNFDLDRDNELQAEEWSKIR